MVEQKKYSEADLRALIDETTRHGAVHALLYFDAHGSDEKQVQGSLIEFVARLANEKGVLYCTGNVLEPFKRPLGTKPSEQGGEGAVEERYGYSTSAEVNILAQDFDTLLNICLLYGPVGAEVLAPNEIRLSLEQSQAMLLDASQHAQEMASVIMKNVLKGEEYKKLQEQMRKRAEIGAALLEKAGKK